MDRKYYSRTLLLSLLPFCSPAVFAADILVTSSDSLQAAVNTAVSGDRVLVSAGTYTENITLKDSGVSIIGAGDGPADTIIVGGIRTTNKSNITISNLTVRKGHNWGDDGNDDPGIRLEQNTSGHILSNLILDGTGRDPAQAARGILFHFDVVNVTVTNVTASGWAHGAFINPRSSVTFTNYTASAGGSLGADGAKGIVVQDSTFTNAGIGMSDHTAPASPNGLTISGTTFTGTSGLTTGSISLWDAQTAGWAGGPVTISDSTFTSSIPLKLEVGASWPPATAQTLSGLTFSNSNNIVNVGPASFVNGSISAIEAGILLAGNGGTVKIGPGSYTELMTQNLGLKLDQPVTLQGVTSFGETIDDVGDVAATITSGGESNWGTNFHVTAANVTIRGLRFEAKKSQNSDSQCQLDNVNKAFEITSNNFTIEHSIVAAASTFNYNCATSTALYFGDEAPDDLNKFTVHGNELHGGITITNGAGDGDTVDFAITDNVFSGHHFLRVRGVVTNVGWLNHSAHVPTTVTGNDMSGVSSYLVQVWGNDAETQVTSSFVANLASNNDLGTHVYVTSADGPKFANYSEYGGTAPAFFVRKSLADAVALAADGNTIHAGGTLTLPSRVTLDKPGLTLTGSGASTVLKPGSSALAVTANGVTISNLSIVQSTPRTGTGIEATANIEDLTLSGVTVNGANVGFRVGSGVGIDGLVVSDSHFDDNSFGWYLAHDTGGAIADDKRVRNVTVTGTSFNGNYTKGLYAEKLERATFDDIEVIESGTLDLPWPPGNGIDINLKGGAYTTISITNSWFEDSGHYEPDLVQVETPRNNLDGALAIKARDDGSYGTNPASLTGVTITGNTFISSDSTLARVALRIGEGDKSNAGPTNVTISRNSFTGFLIPLHNASTNPLIAEQNWWGSSSGPGSSIVGTVDFTPWYSNAGMTTLGGVAEPDPGPGTGTGTGTGTGSGSGNQQQVPAEDLEEIDDIISGVVIPDDGENITDTTVGALSNAAAASSALVTEVVTNIAQVDTSSAIDALSVISKVASVTSNAAQGAAAGTNTTTTQAVTNAGTQALNSFATLLSAIDTKVKTSTTTTSGGTTAPVVLTPVQKEVVQQNTIQTVASAVKLVTAAASETTKQAVLQDVGKIITANLNLGVPLTTTQATALIDVAQGATNTNAPVEEQLDSGVQIKPENKELISKAELSAALEGSGVTEAELDQFLAELADAINPANVVLGDRNGEDALKDGLGGADTETDVKTGVTYVTPPGGTNGQTLTLDGRRMFAVTAPKTIPVRVVSSSIVASTVPDGIRMRANGAVTITSANIANTLVPASYDPIGLFADLKRYGAISIDDAGRLNVIATNFRFSGTFDFNGVVAGSGTPGDATRVHSPSTGASEADLAYQFSLMYRDGTTQVLQPLIHDNAFVASLRGRGLEPKVNRNTGVIDVSGMLFRPSYFVEAREPADVQFWSERKDANGLAYRAADLNGDGTIDVDVISETGVQAAYRLP